MSKIRSMSAGRAGAILYDSNVNGNQGGGNKKGGLATTTNKRVQYVIPAIRSRAYSNPDQRKMIFCVNQLGGVGAPSKMFATTADGSCDSCSKEAECHNYVLQVYRKLLNRTADEAGLRKYTKECEQFGKQYIYDQIKGSKEYKSLWGPKGNPNH